jgi:rhodanese-related sulfurtransferase
MDNEMKYPADVVKLVDECINNYPQAHWIDLSEFFKRSGSESWVIVDARAKEEMAVSTIPGAITMDELSATLESYRGTSILVYCTVGCRSGDATESLMADGYRAHNLWGGVIAWALHGKPFITPDGEETYQVHVFDEKWNVIPPPYETVW